MIVNASEENALETQNDALVRMPSIAEMLALYAVGLQFAPPRGARLGMLKCWRRWNA